MSRVRIQFLDGEETVEVLLVNCGQEGRVAMMRQAEEFSVELEIHNSQAVVLRLPPSNGDPDGL